MDLIQHSSTHIKLPKTRYKMGEEINSSTDGTNNYSTFREIKILKQTLGDPLFSQLEKTFLGPIIKAGSREGGGVQKGGDGLGFSAQLVHFLLSRQILTPRKNELWFYFDGQPMRFSLREFHMVTGLPCLETEEAPIEDKFEWSLLKGKSHFCADLIAQIKNLPVDAVEGKLRLAMLVVQKCLSPMSLMDDNLFRTCLSMN